jgi:hypothetical protein
MSVERRATEDEKNLISMFNKNLGRLACLGIDSIVNRVIPAPVAPPASPASPVSRRSYIDPGIRVAGVSDVHDNMNASYVQKYLQTSGILNLSNTCVDQRARDNELACIVCEDNKVVMLYMPCMHASFCKQCSGILSECPICNKVIDHKVRIFLS